MDGKSQAIDYVETEIIDRSKACAPEASQPRADRRKPSLRSIIYGAFNPRRRRVRREADGSSALIDWHPGHWLVGATLVMQLSAADGLFTVHLINSGLHELNPVLAPLVHGDPGIFALTKIALTAAGVTALVITAQVRLANGLRVAAIFYGLLIAYSGVIAYELYLLQLVRAAT